MTFSKLILSTLLAGSLALGPVYAASPDSSALHISGKLNQTGAPASGEYEFRFQLFTSDTGDTLTPKTQSIVTTENIVLGAWQTTLDLRRFGGVRTIFDDSLFTPAQAASILNNISIPPIGERATGENTERASLQENWRAIEGNWLQISVRRTGAATFVPLSPRQKLGAVPRASTAFTAEHAIVAGSVSEGGVDGRAIAPSAINTSALRDLSVIGSKIAPATVVRSLNGLHDDVTIAAGSGVSLNAVGNTITINSTATGGGGTPLPNGNFMGVDNDNLFAGTATFSVIGGGTGNKVSEEDNYATLGGGQLNRILERSSWSFLGGGYFQQIGPDALNASLGGGYANIITNAHSATIAGGSQNAAGGDYATIGGGSANFAGLIATVGGGAGNRAEGPNSTIGGGIGNSALYNQATIGGGNNNTVHSSLNGTIAGGFVNSMTNAGASFIGGGEQNSILNAHDAVVAGGLNNKAESYASAILGGEGNRTEGPGGFGTVLGGSYNLAFGTHSIAAGYRAHANHSGSFVWNSWQGDVFASARDYEFAVRAPGGVRFETDGAGFTVDGRQVGVGGGNGSVTTAQLADRAVTLDKIAVNGNPANGMLLSFAGGSLVWTAPPTGGGGNGPIIVSTGGGQTEPQARLDQTNPDDYVRLMMNTPRSFWTVGTGPNGWFGFYVPGQSPANTTGDNGAHRFVITANGEVGVGSDQPFAQFHVRGHGGVNLPQARLTQQNPLDSARLRLETGATSWDLAAAPDGSLRFLREGTDRLVLGTDGAQLTTGAGGLTVNGRAVAYADQLGQGGAGGGWALGGNAGTDPAANFLGTVDDRPLNFRANNVPVLKVTRVTKTASDGAVLAGQNTVLNPSVNYVEPNVVGVTVGGGATLNGNTSYRNRAFADHVTIAGGIGNTAGNTVNRFMSGGFVGGGSFNSAEGFEAVIGGGNANIAGDRAAVLGGISNYAQPPGSVIGGGNGNMIREERPDSDQFPNYSGILGGQHNRITNSTHSFIGGGFSNKVHDAAVGAVIGGGHLNAASGLDSVIPGGRNNQAKGSYSFAAGYEARANHSGAFVWNDASGLSAASSRTDEFVVGARGGVRFETGGAGLLVDGVPVGGTGPGTTRGVVLPGADAPLITRGWDPFTSGANSGLGRWGMFMEPSELVAGFPNLPGKSFGIRAYEENGASRNLVTVTSDGLVGIGITQPYGAVHVNTGGGQGNPQMWLTQTNPNDYCRILMNNTRASWALGTGDRGWFRFFAGVNEYNSQGADRFIITADGRVAVGADDPFAQFHVRGGGDFSNPQIRATQQNPADSARFRMETGSQSWDIAANPDGSLRFFSRGADKVIMDPNGGLSATVLNQTSDRNAKRDFKAVDGREVLAKVAAMPISEWQFKNDDAGSRHVGPMAQDFHAAFGVGADDRHISTVDADGVALAAIQGLHAEAKEKDARIRELEERVQRLDELVRKLAERP